MNRWTKAETELLKQNYNRLSNEDLLILFPDRTFISLYKKARKMGMLKDKEIEFLNRSKCRRGEKCPSWKGGRKITPKGYAQLLIPDHHRADRNGYVMEHIYVFEQATGIEVPENCVVHHLDGNRLNNKIDNLCLMTFGAHSTYHDKRRHSKHE